MARPIDPRPTTPPTTIDRPAAEARRARLRAEMAPVGALQSLLVDQIARAMDRLDVAAAWEDAVAPGDPAWMRYHAQAERTLHRCLLELRRLVKEAKLAAPPIPEATPTPKLVQTPARPVVAASRPEPTGRPAPTTAAAAVTMSVRPSPAVAPETGPWPTDCSPWTSTAPCSPATAR